MMKEDRMDTHNRSEHKPPRPPSFWSSRTGIVLITFLAVAGLLLVYEHRMHIFMGNWFLVALLFLCVGVHFFMHGGHGGHGGGHGRDNSTDDGKD